MVTVTHMLAVVPKHLWWESLGLGVTLHGAVIEHTALVLAEGFSPFIVVLHIPGYRAAEKCLWHQNHID